MDGEEKRAIALLVGVSQHDDKKLATLPAAAESARTVADALDSKSVRSPQLTLNPGSNEGLFVALQRGFHAARRGRLVFYFAGNVLRRGSEFLLAANESTVDPPGGCVPFTDLQDLMLNELVSDTLIILNAHKGTQDVPAPTLARSGVAVVGFLHAHDPATADTRVRHAADVITKALTDSAPALKDYLTDGKLDVDALARYLRANAGAAKGDVVVVQNGSNLVLRDLTEELKQAAAPTPAVAETAADSKPEKAPEPAVAKEERDSPAADVPAATAAAVAEASPAPSKAATTEDVKSAAKSEPAPAKSSPPHAESRSRSTQRASEVLDGPEVRDPPGTGTFMSMAAVLAVLACVGMWLFSH